MVSVSISDCDTDAKSNRSASHLTDAFEALFFWSTPLAIGKHWHQTAFSLSASRDCRNTRVSRNGYKKGYSDEKEGQPFRAGHLVSPLE
jgi:hypothetical protein